MYKCNIEAMCKIICATFLWFRAMLQNENSLRLLRVLKVYSSVGTAFSYFMLTYTLQFHIEKPYHYIFKDLQRSKKFHRQISEMTVKIMKELLQILFLDNCFSLNEILNGFGYEESKWLLVFSKMLLISKSYILTYPVSHNE